MRFYTIKIVTGTDGVEIRDLRGFDTLDEALIRYYTDMQSNIGKCNSILYMVTNSANGIHLKDQWVKQVEDTEVTDAGN